MKWTGVLVNLLVSNVANETIPAVAGDQAIQQCFTSSYSVRVANDACLRFNSYRSRWLSKSEMISCMFQPIHPSIRFCQIWNWSIGNFYCFKCNLFAVWARSAQRRTHQINFGKSSLFCRPFHHYPSKIATQHVNLKFNKNNNNKKTQKKRTSDDEIFIRKLNTINAIYIYFMFYLKDMNKIKTEIFFILCIL